MKKLTSLVALLALTVTPLFAMDGKALYKAKKCSMCHGAAGKSSSRMFPSLAGKAADFLAAETLKIKTGERTGGMSRMMKNNPNVKNITEAEAKAIGEYLSSLE